jgi:hypothetical protein
MGMHLWENARFDCEVRMDSKNLRMAPFKKICKIIFILNKFPKILPMIRLISSLLSAIFMH